MNMPKEIGNEICLLNERLAAFNSVNKSDAKTSEVKQRYWYLFSSLERLLADAIILQLSWLYDENGETSLIRWLKLIEGQKDSFFQKLAKNQTEKSTCVCGECNTNTPKKETTKIRIEELKECVSSLSAKIVSNKNKILTIKTLRDKSIAHLEKKVLSNPNKFREQFDDLAKEIEELCELSNEIVRSLYSILHDAHLELVSAHYIGLESLIRIVKEWDEKEWNRK